MMKKIVLILSLITILSLSGFTQKRGFDAGIFFGLNGIHIEGDNEVLYNSSNGTIWGTGGLTAGLTVKRTFVENFYWSFDLRYIRNALVHGREKKFGKVINPTIKNDYLIRPWCSVARRIAEEIVIFS